MSKQELQQILGKRPTIIVAHPDDETMWAGGLVSTFADLEWTAVCCTIPRLDPIRAWDWFSACKTLGIQERLLWPQQEPDPSRTLDSIPLWVLRDASCVVTHGQEGEYGHLHHKQVSSAVLGLKQRTLTFAYKDRGAIKVRLGQEAEDRKFAALKCYHSGSPYNGQIVPKWKALEHRYYKVGGWDPALETFDVHEAV